MKAGPYAKGVKVKVKKPKGDSDGFVGFDVTRDTQWAHEGIHVRLSPEQARELADYLWDAAYEAEETPV